MHDQWFVGQADGMYQARRAELATRLEARLYVASVPALAVRSAAKNLSARLKAARKAIGEALESQRGAVASAADLVTLFDRLVGTEPASCLNAVASVAGRWGDPAATMAATEAALMRAYQRARKDALRHLADDANESQQRLRPLPLRLARRGFKALLSGGLLWRGWLWVSQHWPQITAHLHH